MPGCPPLSRQVFGGLADLKGTATVDDGRSRWAPTLRGVVPNLDWARRRQRALTAGLVALTCRSVVGSCSVDVIIEHLMDRFRTDRGLTGLRKDQLFETFAAYCVFGQFYEEDFDPEQ